MKAVNPKNIKFYKALKLDINIDAVNNVAKAKTTAKTAAGMVGMLVEWLPRGLPRRLPGRLDAFNGKWWKTKGKNVGNTKNGETTNGDQKKRFSEIAGKNG